MIHDHPHNVLLRKIERLQREAVTLPSNKDRFFVPERFEKLPNVWNVQWLRPERKPHSDLD
ncbi:MAG: hypothetical protein ACM3JI_05880, partial [Anaerolineae bacterium]